MIGAGAPGEAIAGRLARARRVVVVATGSEAVDADEILVAVGRERRGAPTSAWRRPGSSPEGRSPVDDSLRVPGHATWRCPVGDVNGGTLLTHTGRYRARPSFPTRSELWLRLLEAYGL